MANDNHDENNTAEGLEEDQVTLESRPESAGQSTGQSTGQPDTADEAGESGLRAQVETLKEELTLAQEQALRAAAEAQNIRRRAEQDVEKAHKFGLEKFVSDLLPVADNLERAISAAESSGEDIKAVTEGVELTLKSLLDALKRHNVEPVDPLGEPFDPRLHQAMTAVEKADVEPNTVVNVFQRGYTLHGRLVRPAMVVVSKAPEAAGS